MTRAAKLKVFRTPIGFYDAYVAAPSRKAALAAWGTGRDLFARGVAEEVTDPALVAEPLAKPGEVVRRSRGTAAEQIAALRADTSRPVAPRTVSEPLQIPKPDRSELDQAAAAIEAAEEQRARAMRDFDDRAAALARERRTAEREFQVEAARLERDRDRAARAYERALAAWRRGSA